MFDFTKLTKNKPESPDSPKEIPYTTMYGYNKTRPGIHPEEWYGVLKWYTNESDARDAMNREVQRVCEMETFHLKSNPYTASIDPYFPRYPSRFRMETKKVPLFDNPKEIKQIHEYFDWLDENSEMLDKIIETIKIEKETEHNESSFPRRQ